MKTETKLKLQIDVILFIIFLILKLCGTIQWKWVWVFSPIWIAWIAEFIISIGTIIVIAIINAIRKSKSKRHFASGPSLVWDPKTSTMYGPQMTKDNEE